MAHITTLSELASFRSDWRSNGKAVVWTNGCFDLLHSGHVRSLQAAKQQGDILIVGINSDRSVRQIKGENRPIVGERDRAELVAALGCVDHVIIFDQNTPETCLAVLQPDVHCKGADYKNGAKALPEAEIVKAYGGRIAFLDLKTGRSTTSVIEKIEALHRRSNEAADGSELPASTMLHDFLAQRLKRSRVLIVGDVMLDEYIIGHITRISPEAPVPVIDIAERRYSCGGAANVAVNIAGLGASAFLSGLAAHDVAGGTLRAQLSGKGLPINGLLLPAVGGTICKSRLVAGQQQIARIDQEAKRSITDEDRANVLSFVSQTLPEVDCCVLSDYGKGLLSPSLCKSIINAAREAGKPVIVDPKGRDFSKYFGCTVITPNLKEAGVAAEIDIETEDDLQAAAARLLQSLPGTCLLITRGPDGMTLFREGTDTLTVPTVARRVFDVVGAGDTAVATLAAALGGHLSIETAIRLANIAAGVVVEQHGTVAISLVELGRRSETAHLLSAMTEPRTLETLTASA